MCFLSGLVADQMRCGYNHDRYCNATCAGGHLFALLNGTGRHR